MNEAASAVATRAPQRAAQLLDLKLWIIGGIALACSLTSLTITANDQTTDNPGLAVVLEFWISVPFLVSGLLAWRRRPNNRFGPLMLAAGFLAMASSLQHSGYRIPFTIGVLLDLPLGALYLHVMLTFPDGRLRHTPERLLVILGYVASIGLSAVVLLLGAYQPRNAIAIADEPQTAGLVQDIQLSTLSLVALGGFVLVVVRSVQAGRSRIRAARLIINTFALGLLMLAALYAGARFNFSFIRPLQYATLGIIGLAPIAFLMGILDARLARAGIGDLLLHLDSEPTTSLQKPLAKALRDPSLEIAYWLPEYKSWADAGGEPVELPEPGSHRETTTIDRRGTHVATLIHDPSLKDEPELLEAVSAAASIALENARLQAQLRAQLSELQGSRMRVIEESRKERQRLERDLHDGAQQRLVTLALELGILQNKLAADPVAAASVGRARNEVSSSLAELRDLARGIYPAVLGGHGLAVALESVAARSAIPVGIQVDLPARPSEAVEVAAYYVVSESLTNVEKHARATSVVVTVERQADLTVVEIVDDGRGGANSEAGSGIRGLADRVEALGGQLRVWSPADGGTRVRAEFPCE